MSDIILARQLSQINTTYVNRKSIDLLTSSYQNTFLRVGEKYVALLLRLLNLRKTSETENFDYSGFAAKFFDSCVAEGYNLLVIGGKRDELSIFIGKLKTRFPGIKVVSEQGFSNLEHYIKLYEEIMPDVCVLGLGNPKQNILLELLANKGYVGIHTCGAFISQEGRHSPVYTSKRVPRWFQRSIKEKGHFKRVLITSFIALIDVLRFATKRD